MVFFAATRAVFSSAFKACCQHLKAPSARNVCNAKAKCDLAMNESNEPVTEYNVPVTEYNVPITEYNVPITRYSRPITEYNGPLTRYNEPITRLNEPITRYNAPVTEYNVPISKYNGPLTEYNVPLTKFEAPITKVNLPIATENTPVTVYSGRTNMFKGSAAESAGPKRGTLWGPSGPPNKRNVFWDATRIRTTFEANRYRTSDMENYTSDAPCGPIGGPISSHARIPRLPMRQGDAFQESVGSTSYHIKDVLTVPPEPLSEHEDNVSTDNGSSLEEDTRALVERFLTDFNGLSKPRWVEGSEMKAMKLVVDDILHKHRLEPSRMVDQVLLEAGDDSFVPRVARFMFADGITTWERIAMLVTFGANLSQKLMARGRKECVVHVAQDIAAFLVREQRDWLLHNDAWNGFAKHFGVAKEKSSFMKTVLATAGLVGVGVTLAGAFAYISSR